MTGVVIWFTGKPSSGKSTLARRLQVVLSERGIAACLLDGDEVRAALVPKPGYDARARDDFYATLANLAALLAHQELVVLVAATAHARVLRERARNVAPRFIEVHVDAADAELLQRDSKGLYAAVSEGRAHGVPGADLPYEPPLAAEVTALGGKDDAALTTLLGWLDPSAAGASRPSEF